MASFSKNTDLLKSCTFLKAQQLSQKHITEIRSKYPYFFLSILYLYTSPNNPPPPHICEATYVYVPRRSDDWQWNLDHIQL